MPISYVIPAYNSESMLSEAVDSIFAGNFEEGDEVIIVNDASSDNTYAAAVALKERYSPHVSVIDNPENKGAPASRNVGIRASKNEFIFNLDADNILVPGMIAKLRSAITKDNVDLAAFEEYHYFKDTPEHITHRWICRKGLFTLADIFAGHVTLAPGGNFLYRKSAWERAGAYWEYGKGLHEAFGFSLKLLVHGATCSVVPGTYYFHRYSHQSLFVRESQKENEEAEITRKFIEPVLPLLDDASRAYVLSTPDWYPKLDSHPLHLADGSVGHDGKIVWTSPLQQAVYLTKRFIRRL